MVTFPSKEWFEAVATRYRESDVKRLGYMETDVGLLVEGCCGDHGYVIEFRGYDVPSVRDADELSGCAFVIAGPLGAWEEMVENIAAHGEADLEHTLNRLTMAGVPLRVEAGDQLQQDAFFRFSQTFQSFFDASAGVETQFPALSAV